MEQKKKHKVKEHRNRVFTHKHPEARHCTINHRACISLHMWISPRGSCQTRARDDKNHDITVQVVSITRASLSSTGWIARRLWLSTRTTCPRCSLVEVLASMVPSLAFSSRVDARIHVLEQRTGFSAHCPSKQNHYFVAILDQCGFAIQMQYGLDGRASPTSVNASLSNEACTPLSRDEIRLWKGVGSQRRAWALVARSHIHELECFSALLGLFGMAPSTACTQ